jgi:DNA-binding FrmR family transcriptional regulator
MDWRDPADQRADQMDEADVIAAFDNTENEIFAHTLDMEPEDLPGYRGDNTDRSLEDAEGWDGRPLPLAEIAASNQFDGIDRPLEMERDARLAAKDGEISRLKNELIERHLRPEREAREQAQREADIVELYDKPHAALDHIAGQNRLISTLTENHVNSHMERAHREHGAEFEAAYRDLTSLDPKDPLHRQLVQRIAYSRDPGAALMEWHGSGRDSDGGESRAGRTAGNFWVPPSRGGRRGAAPPPLRGSRRGAEQNDASDPEAEIFNDASGGDDFWAALGGGMGR